MNIFFGFRYIRKLIDLESFKLGTEKKIIKSKKKNIHTVENSAH